MFLWNNFFLHRLYGNLHRIQLKMSNRKITYENSYSSVLNSSKCVEYSNKNGFNSKVVIVPNSYRSVSVCFPVTMLLLREETLAVASTHKALLIKKNQIKL